MTEHQKYLLVRELTRRLLAMQRKSIPGYLAFWGRLNDEQKRTEKRKLRRMAWYAVEEVEAHVATASLRRPAA